MLTWVCMCYYILIFYSVKCDEPPEDLAIEPNDDVKYFNEFDVITYTCKARKTTSKYTPYLFWYHSMNTKLSVPILCARNDLGVGNVDLTTLELNLTLHNGANMSKIFCLQRYFDWEITKYHNVAKSKSITLVLKKNDINGKGFKEDNLSSQKNVPGTRKEPTESGQSSTPLIIGCVLASLIISVLVIIIIVLCRRNRVVIVQESEVEHVYEEIDSHLIEKSTVRYAKIDVPRNQSAQKDLQPSCQYAVIVGKLVPKDTDRYQHPALA